MSHNLETLQNRVLAASKSKDWEEARREWELIYIFDEPGGSCICEHHPITEHCVIRNTLNNNTLTVGNVCVQRFGGKLEDMARLAAQAFNRLRKNEGGRANGQLLEVAYRGRTYTLCYTGPNEQTTYFSNCA
jgi:hypothetical protein